MSDNQTLEERILNVLQTALPNAINIRLTGLQRTFGGNARQAWSFDLVWQENSEAREMPCILLSQMPGSHVDSDIEMEYGVLNGLTGSGLCTPAAIALDADGTITGGAAIILERLEGKADVVAFLKDATGGSSRDITGQLAAITAGLHKVSWEVTGLKCGDNPVLAQIKEWENIFIQHRQEPNPPMAYLFRWMKKNAPEPTRLSLVHGDLRPGNFLYDSEGITALLDWEMAHVGDPLEDVAWIYRALWSPEKFLPLDEFVSLYEQNLGQRVSRRTLKFYQIFSEMKFAALSVTASYSVASGESANMRHADRAAKVPECLRICFELIDSEDWEVPDVAA
ncbi:MAG: phosphotransferase family protein [Thiohalomonadaceae bacterium]